MNALGDRWVFEARPDSCRKARRVVTDVLSALDLAAASTAAALVVSELSTNAVLHARTDFEVRLVVDLDRSIVRVEVADASPVAPMVRRFSAEATSGRGLALVESLASSWGVDLVPGGRGKTVWAELDLGQSAGVFDIDSITDL